MKVIVIVGPTAVGKTRLGIELAKQFDGEIISGDSMQIYQTLDVGTAKVTNEEAEGVPHHLIDTKEVTEEYSVADFQKEAREKIKEITKRNRVPIIVGGTGLYIESLLYNVSHGKGSQKDSQFRKEKNELADKAGNQILWEELKTKDSKAAETIHANNRRRVIRALEVIHTSGEKYSDLQQEKTDSLYDSYTIALTTDRSMLYERINTRVDWMMQDGLLDEARALWEIRATVPQASRGIGYKELFSYFDGTVTLENAVETIKQNSRRYAKRQLTWFRNRVEVTQWADLIERPQEINNIKKRVAIFLENRGE
ncbi:tRNA (adenosine(37)-N6)-dimethylallyltransferase MiaA [Lacticigenium naphthae]|uniref:tRNA (adenosine(37)-N6)-dimethylallyltransferase MiaA n=1 Tax=Lacticigenium naphthae TaxID=515351 RepID=UPI000488C4B8|nr:tRNA (adenosine(37)-N6)-dimethylallyltransferase MiaA [Lacticigenium naphthae]